MPALVTVNVEPRSSSGVSVPVRAFSASASTSARSSSTLARVAAADDRHDEPLRRSARRCRGRSGRGRRSRRPRAARSARGTPSAPPPSRAARVGSSSLRSTFEKSHSSTYVTAGTSRWARVRCSTICRRTPRTFSRRPSGLRATSLPARGGADVVLGDAAARAGRRHRARSTPSSCAIRRTSGVAWTVLRGRGRSAL